MTVLRQKPGQGLSKQSESNLRFLTVWVPSQPWDYNNSAWLCPGTTGHRRGSGVIADGKDNVHS